MLVETKPNDRFYTPDQRWNALIQKDPSANGAFYFAVKTTGVYCRPTCASRLPNPENVRFFDTPQAAEAAGFRACKRCRPDQAVERPEQAEWVIKACAMIEQAEVSPTLPELAQAVGLSPYYFQRLFRKLVGITPRQYFAQKRAERLRTGLAGGQPVTAALYNAGYGSSAHFYGQAAETLGMKPRQYRSGAPGVAIRYTILPCSLGWVLIAATPTGLCAIEFGDQPNDLEQILKDRFSGAAHLGEDEQFAAWVKQTLDFIEQPAGPLDLPLDIQGTAFQRKVWAALREIPGGSTVSYSELARRIGQPGAARAAAQACAAKRLAVAIPCHRVVRENGDLGGYKWGLDRKYKLLAKERNK